MASGIIDAVGAPAHREAIGIAIWLEGEGRQVAQRVHRHVYLESVLPLGAVAQRAGIVDVDEEAGARERRHLHDARGTSYTLMTTTDLTDAKIAAIMGWAEDDVARTQRIYVDDVARTVAIDQRIARGVQAGIVNRDSNGGRISGNPLICGCSSMAEQKLPKHHETAEIC